MRQYKENDVQLMLKAHHEILDRLKDSKNKYNFATPPWTPAMEVVVNMNDGQDNMEEKVRLGNYSASIGAIVFIMIR